MSHGPLILLVEDDENDALIAKRALHKAGVACPVTHLRDGEQAINYLSGYPPHEDRGLHPLPSLILLDLKMPKFTGFDVLTWLQSKPDLAKIPVIVLTGSIHPEDRKEAQRLGAVGYEVKPVEFEQIVEIARNVKHRLK
jgi:CheY-like chemotaxis protein